MKRQAVSDGVGLALNEACRACAALAAALREEFDTIWQRLDGLEEEDAKQASQLEHIRRYVRTTGRPPRKGGK